MKNIWEAWTSALSAQECDIIVQRASQYTPQEATVGFAGQTKRNTSYRTSVIRWLDAATEQAIVDRVMQFVRLSNRTNFGVDIIAPFDIQYTEYHGTVGGKYDWHQDVWLESDRPYDRKLSLVVQLSDPADYEGGAFEFFGIAAPGEKFAPRGSILIFPSWLQHRVMPVTQGLRRSLVSWVEGPRWR